MQELTENNEIDTRAGRRMREIKVGMEGENNLNKLNLCEQNKNYHDFDFEC